MTPCRICGERTYEHGRAGIRKRYDALFLRCESCGFIFVDAPNWLDEAYAEPINASDTGYVDRNIGLSRIVRLFIEKYLRADDCFLDYAAGYGLFVRLMRDLGYDFRWYDLYCQNLFSRGFEVPMPLTGPFEAVTAFEVFEHLTDPRNEVAKLSTTTDCLLFSTTLLPEPAPAPDKWWYFGLEHGQHVAFYTRKSLELLGQEFGYSFISDGGGFHVFSRKPIPRNAFSRLRSRWTRFWLPRMRRRVPLTVSDMNSVINQISAK